MTWFVGIDEAGKGPVAGPLVIAAFMHDLGHDNSLPKIFRDSKKLSEKQREAAYEEHVMRLVREGHAVVYVQETPVSAIDKLGMEVAWRLAVTEAVAKCVEAQPHVGLVMIDGPRMPSREQLVKDVQGLAMFGVGEWSMYERGLTALERCGRSLVKADDLIWYVSAASIAAKVYRDRAMTIFWHHKYPEYNLAQHKGYGTKQHIQLILEHGLVPGLHHRTRAPHKARDHAIWRDEKREGET